MGTSLDKSLKALGALKHHFEFEKGVYGLRNSWAVNSQTWVILGCFLVPNTHTYESKAVA